LTPLQPGLFRCEGVPDMRIKLKIENAAVQELVVLYANGVARTYPRRT
jgi:hypothetical protein